MMNYMLKPDESHKASVSMVYRGAGRVGRRAEEQQGKMKYAATKGNGRDSCQEAKGVGRTLDANDVTWRSTIGRWRHAKLRGGTSPAPSLYWREGNSGRRRDFEAVHGWKG